MALTKATVTGRAPLPNDLGPDLGAFIEFRLSGYETDGDAAILPAPVIAPLSSDGGFSVELWPTGAGPRRRQYNAAVYIGAPVPRQRLDLGGFKVPDAGSYNLSDLLGVIPSDLPSVNLSAVEAAQAAQNAEAAAQTYRDEAASFAGFRDYADRLSLFSEPLSYGAGTGQVQAGDVLRTRAEGFSYRVALAVVSDHDVEINGVKLYVLAVGPFFLPEQFGCAGDGETDDTVPLQRWLNFLSDGRNVGFMSRVYAVSSTVYLKRGSAPEKGEWRIETTGDALTASAFPSAGIKWIGGANSTVLEVNESQNCKIGVISIWVDKSTSPGMIGVLARNRDASGVAIMKSSIFDGFAIDGCKYGVRLGDYTNDGYDSNVDDVRIKNIHTYDTANPFLIDSDAQDNIVIDKFWNGGPAANVGGGVGQTRDFIFRVLRGGNGLMVRHMFMRVDDITRDNAAIDIRSGHIQIDFCSFEGISNAGDLVLDGVYQWVESAGGVNEFYLVAFGGGSPRLNSFNIVEENEIRMSEGEIGALSAGEFAYGDNDELGFKTLYVRLSDGSDPDSKPDGYLTGFTNAQCRWIDLTAVNSRARSVIQNLSGAENIRDADEVQADLSHRAGQVLIGCSFGSGNVRVTRQVTAVGTSFIEGYGFVEDGGAAYTNHVGTVVQSAKSSPLENAPIFGKTALEDLDVTNVRNVVRPGTLSRVTRLQKSTEIAAVLDDGLPADVFRLAVANGSHVSVKVEWHLFRSVGAARNFSAGGVWHLDVTVDNSGNVTLGPIASGIESQALDGISSLTVTPDLVSGANEVTFRVAQANNQGDAARFAAVCSFMGNTAGASIAGFDAGDLTMLGAI